MLAEEVAPGTGIQGNPKSGGHTPENFVPQGTEIIKPYIRR
jgi:hypothetical protein